MATGALEPRRRFVIFVLFHPGKEFWGDYCDLD
jgi:hypothetical protein